MRPQPTHTHTHTHNNARAHETTAASKKASEAGLKPDPNDVCERPKTKKKQQEEEDLCVIL